MKMTKNSNLGKFVPKIPKFAPFFRKSGFVTFFYLLQTNLTQKSKKSYDRFSRKIPDLQTEKKTSEGGVDQMCNMDNIHNVNVYAMDGHGKIYRTNLQSQWVQ